MRGLLGAALAKARTHRLSGEYRRAADQATAAYIALAERDRSNADAHAAPKVDTPSGNPPRPTRRTPVSMSFTVVFLVAALIAASIGVSHLNEAQPGRSQIALAPNGAAPAALRSVSPSSGTATGYAPTAPRPAASVSHGPAQGTGTGTPTTTDSAPGPGTPTATSSAPEMSALVTSAAPSLLELCRAVVAVGNGWPSVLKSADRAMVIAAAGRKNEVLPYCMALLAPTPTHSATRQQTGSRHSTDHTSQH